MIVMKFGGTSMADAAAIQTVADILVDYRDVTPVAVVSAMAGVTDQLLDMAELARCGRHRSVERAFAALIQRHEKAADALLSNQTARGLWLQRHNQFQRELHDLLLGATLLREVSARARDAISGYGELFSAALLTAHLCSRDIDAVFADARQFIVTDETHGGAIPLMERTIRRTTRYLQPILQRRGIPVVTGFIGATATGVPTTLGRGGSDFSASIIGAVLQADAVWIWGDVDGILTTDPKLEPNAKLIHHLSFAEAAELAYFGAKVLHPRTIWPAIGRGIPIRVRNTFNRACEGTLIEAVTEAHPDIVKGITAITGLALITVEGSGMMGVPGIAARVFGAVARAGASVLMISQGSSEHTICFVVEKCVSESVRRAIDEEFRLERLHTDVAPVEIHAPVAIVAAVGDGMRGTPGVAARIFTAVGSAGVNILAIAQGSSERNISFVVEEGDAARAVHALHSEYVDVS
jgi:aspartokinase/homoserine dehydrogenase 1